MGYNYMTFELLVLVVVWPFLLLCWIIIDAKSSMPFIEELESSKPTCHRKTKLQHRKNLAPYLESRQFGHHQPGTGHWR
jgi:hypothetical protein